MELLDCWNNAFWGTNDDNCQKKLLNYYNCMTSFKRQFERTPFDERVQEEIKDRTEGKISHNKNNAGIGSNAGDSILDPISQNTKKNDTEHISKGIADSLKQDNNEKGEPEIPEEKNYPDLKQDNYENLPNNLTVPSLDENLTSDEIK